MENYPFPLPAMSDARRNALIAELRTAQSYLEFGMGGSTTLAAWLGVPNVISVDSSKDWVDQTAALIGQIAHKGRVQLLHANLGETAAWGYPVDGSNISNWPSYYSGPWTTVRANGLEPDLVLIDGRFRVACFLYSLINMKSGSTLLWDDYAHRPEYHHVQDFLAPSIFHDDMAVFKITGPLDIPGIVARLFTCLYTLD